MAISGYKIREIFVMVGASIYIHEIVVKSCNSSLSV